jgi:hypothetical protein
MLKFQLNWEVASKIFLLGSVVWVIFMGAVSGFQFTPDPALVAQREAYQRKAEDVSLRLKAGDYNPEEILALVKGISQEPFFGFMEKEFFGRRPENRSPFGAYPSLVRALRMLQIGIGGDPKKAAELTALMEVAGRGTILPEETDRFLALIVGGLVVACALCLGWCSATPPAKD